MKYITVKAILDYVDELKLNNFSRNTKLMWLNEIEYRVQTDVMLFAAESVGTVPDDDNYELLVPAPFYEIYYDYLFMKISEHVEESAGQNNRAATFDKAFTRFMRWWADTYHPADGNAVFKGYYVMGPEGPAGSTPRRGIEYWTPADVEDIERYLETMNAHYEGEYSDETEYGLNAVVKYEDDVYWHKTKAHTTGVDPTDDSVWALVLKPSAVSIDRTLTQENKAAEAKAVGERFDNIMDDIETDPTLTYVGRPADAAAVGNRVIYLTNRTDTNSSDIVDNKVEIATQKARIDNIVSGTTPSDSELAAIRIGAYAKSYDSADEAVRRQIYALNDSNCVDLIKSCATSLLQTHEGITFALDVSAPKSTLSISGTSSADAPNYSIFNLLGSPEHISPYFMVGRKYHFKISDMPQNTLICVTEYRQTNKQTFYTEDFDFVITSDLTGFRISARVAGGKTVSGIAKISCLTSYTNDELFENIVSNDKDSRAIIDDAKKVLSAFTPLQDVAASGSNNTFSAGKIYEGIPYSNKIEREKTVLFDLSLESVFTQFKNPYSEIYAFDPASSVSESKVWCGSVCSTWVSWATGRPMNLVVDQIEREITDGGGWKMRYDATAQKYIKECDVGDLEVGDVLWQEGHVALISGFQVGKNGLEQILITEQWKPLFRADWYSVDEFWKRIETGYYPTAPSVPHTPFSIGRFPDDYKIKTLPRLRLVEDIITNKGDNVHFALGSDVWTYITDETHTLTIIKPDGTTETVDYTTLPKDGNNPVYNLKSVLTETGQYEIIGAHGTYASRITIFNPPGDVTAEKDGNNINVTIGTHAGLKVVGFKLIALNTIGSGDYDIPSEVLDTSSPYYIPGITGANGPTYSKYCKELSADTTTFTISNVSLPSTRRGCYIRVYYETGCGLTYKDSNVVKVNEVVV